MGKRKVKLNFEGVETFTRCEEGQHIVKIVRVEEKVSQAGNDLLNITFEVVKGNSKGAKVYDNFVLGETSLWKLKALLDAVKMKADGKVALDLDLLEGKICIIEVGHEEYEGKLRSRINEFKKLEVSKTQEDDEDEDEEEDEPLKKPVKKEEPKKKPVKKVVVEEDDEDDDFEDDEDEEEEEPKKSKKPAKSTKKPTKKPIVEEDEDDDDFEDEDEEPVKKEVKKPAKKKVVEEDDEDDDDDDWEE